MTLSIRLKAFFVLGLVVFMNNHAYETLYDT